MKSPQFGPRIALVAALLVGDVALIGTQGTNDDRLRRQLQQLFPSASSFSPKGGNPPHFTAYTNSSGPGTPLGFAFWTTELAPLERGYDGPIRILVGMDPKGILTGIIVVDHYEPYGYFSVDTPRFAAQFKGKNIRDPFAVGGDIDAISTASISVGSATRAVRASGRRIARELLTPPRTTQ